MTSPTPHEIIALAVRLGYRQRRPEASATLFFEEETSQSGSPTLINVYYTTRSIMTLVDHPTQGYASNQLWRSNTYQTLEELEAILINPRLHTGKGYRDKNQACRGCIRCGQFKKRTEFSDNQWRKGPDANKCKECLASEEKDSKDLGGIADGLQDIKLEEDYVHMDDNVESEFPSLTADALKQHEQTTGNAKVKKERRQFNCPDCPKEGRGKYVFFKKVPVYKPIVKCPQCKKVKQENCRRLTPIPKKKEKGYGLFKCNVCRATWGSSRAIAHIGQECFKCKANHKPEVWVKPFRLEVVKKKGANDGILGGGPYRMNRRVPRNPIQEDEEAVPDYTESDQQRHVSAASNALVGGGDNNTYDFVKREEDDSVDSINSSTSTPTTAPSGYSHRCQGCATGICKSRFLPKSQRHDNSDGDTVSTSMSVATNSSMAKADYLDRDLNFIDYDDDDDDDDE